MPRIGSRFSTLLSLNSLLWVAVLGLTVFKFWLVAAQPLVAAANAAYDDALFVAQADSILQGQWLGDYNSLTLAKGAGYSLFIAATHLAHLPLPFAQQLLYAAACLGLALAVRPLFRSGWLIPLIYLVLLFNPMSYEGPVMARALRQHVATPAVMLMIAGFCGLWFYRRANYYQRIAWAVIAGSGLLINWLSREESILALPAALLLAAGATWMHRDVLRRPPTWILLALPWAIWIAGCQLVCAINYAHYGAWVTVETRTAEFNDAYGAMLRVRAQEWQPFVPVARETRERIYQVSPAFAELRGYFEGESGQNWASSGTSLTGRAASERQIAGGWWMWALRAAVEEAGHARNARESLKFYRRLAKEINRACDLGLLDARPPRAGVTPVWDDRYRAPWLDALAQSQRFIVNFEHLHVRPGFSSGEADSIALFGRVTRAKLAAPEGSPANFTALDRARFRILEDIGEAYQRATPWAVKLAALATLALLIPAVRRRHPGLIWVQGALLGTVVLAVAAIALINISLFPAIITGYFHGSYPLMLMFAALGLAVGLDFIPQARRLS